MHGKRSYLKRSAENAVIARKRKKQELFCNQIDKNKKKKKRKEKKMRGKVESSFVRKHKLPK